MLLVLWGREDGMSDGMSEVGNVEVGGGGGCGLVDKQNTVIALM